jgi:sec-independent protein translocase protein TatA
MDLGAPELIIVLVIALLMFGPGRIANVAREIGEGIRTFRQGMQSSETEKKEE